jgi:O-succinylbenzoic acid--CoA ligase
VDAKYLPPAVERLARQLRAALDGGPLVAPLPRVTPLPAPPGTALVVQTSGSTGTPREVALSANALVASARATLDRLGGPGRWVLSLPATHIAGVQIVVRALLAHDAGVAQPLVAADPDTHFTPSGLAELLTLALDDGAPVCISLVPTQLHRVLAAADDGAPDALQALARCSAVLLGGAATDPGLLARATGVGVRIVRTYGMSETAGGCVYDGIPLDGALVRTDGAGVIDISGPMLATEYVGDDEATAAAFRTDDADNGRRWFRTSDLGQIDGDGHLTVLGRADDIIVTGGVNVAPGPVGSLLAEILPGLVSTDDTNGVCSTTRVAMEVCVVGVPDPEWGQEVVAVVADGRFDGPGLDPLSSLSRYDRRTIAAIRQEVTARLGAPSAPRRIYRTGALPTTGPGKVDRRALIEAVIAADTAH